VIEQLHDMHFYALHHSKKGSRKENVSHTKQLLSVHQSA